MRKRRSIVLIATILLTIGVFTACKGDISRMTRDELKTMLGNPDLVIIDVRLEREWNKSDSKIKGAVREEPVHIESWANKYPKDKILVLYCN
jgi:rhodanese-related sulfurtransferase